MTEAAGIGGPTTMPYWWEAAPRPHISRSPLPERIDVAIVGGGYAGLAAALTLACAGREVLVLEAGDAGIGASTLNGGQAGGDVKPSFPLLARRMGLPTATAIYKEGRKAADHLAHLIESEGIDCAYRRVGRLEAVHRPRDYDALGREADLVNRHLGLDMHLVPRSQQHTEIGSDAYHGVAVRPDVAALHPGLLHQGLLNRALAAGVRYATHTAVQGHNRGGKGVSLDLGGKRMAARDVVVCTNGYTGGPFPWLRRRIIPIRSQIIATEPLAPGVLARLLPRGRVVVDGCRLHSYYRPSPDGRRLLFGGRAGAGRADPRHAGRHLYRRMTTVFPELSGVGITHAWSGLTGYTFDTLPHVAERDGVHYAAGFCGEGVVWAPYLGHKAALRVLGDADGRTVLDDLPFSSRPLYTGRPWFLPGVLAWYGLLDRLRL